MQNSPRLLLPQAIVSVLGVLIDELDDVPSAARVELRVLRARLCRIYRLPNPMEPASATDVAQGVAEADGEEIRDET